MGFAIAPDRTRLYFEEAGSGTPVLFIHEFAGDHRSWEPQLRSFSRRYRCIVYAARGYPPSDVPEEIEAYSMETAVQDAVAVLDRLEIDRAHIVGMSMGGFTSLHLGLTRPERTRSVVVGATGCGAHPDARESFRGESEAIAAALDAEGAASFATRYAVGPARVQFQNKDPRGWKEFADNLAQLSATGASNTMRGVQRERPSLYEMTNQLSAMTVPVLLVVGDEDDGCLDANLMLKRAMPSAGLAVLPRTGHTTNLEEPELFNKIVLGFIGTVDSSRWELRDPRSVSSTATGIQSRD